MSNSTLASRALCTLISLGALCLGAASCGASQTAPVDQGPPSYRFEIAAHVKTKGGDPVPSIPVLVDGKTVGYTDADGLFRAVLTEQMDEQDKPIVFALGESDVWDYEGTSTIETNLVEQIQWKDREQNTVVTSPLKLDVTAINRLTDYMVWVKAECDEDTPETHCADLPVLVDGDQIARTDQAGRVNFTVTRPTGQEIEVKINNQLKNARGEQVDLYPPQPVYAIKLADEPQLYVIEESFKGVAQEEEDKPRARKKPRSRTRTKPKRSKPKPPKKKPVTKKPRDGSSDNPIELF